MRRAVADDIVTRLRKQVARAEVDGVLPSWDFAKVVWEAADEIERLQQWATYEHAGYCGCAGGNKECVERAYTVWKKMQDG